MRITLSILSHHCRNKEKKRFYKAESDQDKGQNVRFYSKDDAFRDVENQGE